MVGYAPEKRKGGVKYYDWTELEKIDCNVRVCLAFNPLSFKPILLPNDDSFENVETEILDTGAPSPSPRW